MMLEFLQSVSYDHSILLDFLISAETVEFMEFLGDYLRMCILDWNDLCKACVEVDSCQVMTDDATSTVKSIVHILVYVDNSCIRWPVNKDWQLIRWPVNKDRQ